MDLTQDKRCVVECKLENFGKPEFRRKTKMSKGDR